MIQTQISAYIKKLSRRHPNFKSQDHQLLHVHDVMQFQVLGETSHVLAYDYFPIEVNLIQKFGQLNFICLQLSQDLNKTSSMPATPMLSLIPLGDPQSFA